uniref:Putative salivary secreted protein n=1 Tax=Ixodes ricinus TaxID=34613 RepID=A0A6B0UL98_IXORI
MQLTLFIVIVTFAAHLSCEEQSASRPAIFADMKDLPPACKDNLKKQIEDKCEGNPYQPELLEFTGCRLTCGYENDNIFTRLTARRTFFLKDGTPCGHNKVCKKGFCDDICKMTFV